MGAAGFWLETRPLVLASASEVRRAVLEAAGLPVEAVPSGIDERALQSGLGDPDAGMVAAALADAKALAVSVRCPDRLVIGADQVLCCEGELFAKPSDHAAARRQLARLSGRTHVLHSAFCLARDGGGLVTRVETAGLTMRALSPAAIERYVGLAGEAATRSVGAYEVEGLGIHLFERIEGEHTTILGLPMLPLLAELRRLGAVAG